MRVLIVGCGYVGLPLGAELARLGHDVFGVRRSASGEAELKAAGITPLVADLTKPEELTRLPGSFDWVVNAVSSTRGGAAEYRQVYLQGTKNLIEWLAPTPPKKFVFTSSTSVYGQNDGSAVDESSATEPSSETSRVLIGTERALFDAWRERRFPSVALRVAGIYGPDRGHLFLQYLRDEARLFGDGSRLINMVHRDDVVGAIVTALERGQPGESYNVADDEAVSHREFFEWLSATLGKPMPPIATEAENAARKRGLTNKRVLNSKLKAAGWSLKYPTFREGYAAEMKRLGLVKM
ncbi:MAG: SDR family oxidoreductase [Verrucomicrobia bacterium]|nr:SDR family oxidoreductase [Verrucomicrobiota bacterium]